MMASHVLSRFLPAAEGDVSFFDANRYDTQRNFDVESQRPTSAGTRGAFHDEEEDPDPNQLLFEGGPDGANEQTSPSPASQPSTQASPTLNRVRPKWLDQRRKGGIEDEDDVPESFLIETHAKDPQKEQQRPPSSKQAMREAQWRATQEQHGLHSAPPPRQGRRGQRPQSSTAGGHGPSFQPNPQADAMWLYTNAANLDAFLLEVYQYYVQHGVWSILLSRVLNLLTELFVFSFAMFLTTCIDYSLVSSSNSTAEIMIPKCMSKASWIKNAALYFFVIYWLFQVTRHAKDVKRLFRLREFYLHVLGISDSDMQTVSWVRIVEGLVKVQDANVVTANPPAKLKTWLGYDKPQQRINAESIANRLMRQDNFYVAMYNKEIFDFTLPLPFAGSRSFYSKSLEWCIDFCLTNFIFDEQRSIRPFCLDVKNRKALVNAMRTRLQFAALASVVLAPFNIIRFCIMYFFRYYTEFTRNPSRVSARSFTPFAEWKIREFNELDHLFQRRLRQAHPFAEEYLKQFPKDKTDQVCRFVAFVSGAIAAVLTIATLLDHELFLGFEVTPGRTAVFWLTVMVGIFGFAHGMLPDEHEVHDPVLHLKEVLWYTHYMPAHWKDRLHSEEVRAEFAAMYQMKVMIFVEEILSLIVAPWILLRNATFRSERIIDFFREQTVHVDGIGYQCNFAVFGFKKDPNAEDPTTVLGEPDGLRDDYYGLKDDKMASSVHNFMQYYSHMNHRNKSRLPKNWQPPPNWPPLASPPTIKEEAAPSASTARIPGAPKAIRGSPRDARHPPASRSTYQASMYQPRPPPPTRPSQSHGISESRIMSQDSDLHDYADAPGKDKDDIMESDAEGEEGKAVEEGAGVLGMLAQFSKAKVDKRPGVSI